MVKESNWMNGTLFCRVMLIAVAVLAFALNGSQKSDASTDSYNINYPDDSPFSLPFDSDIADQSYGEDYQSDSDIPFPWEGILYFIILKKIIKKSIYFFSI